MKTIGLFAGIGGIESGFRSCNTSEKLLCEIMPEAQSILRTQFPSAEIKDDVRQLKELPDCDILCAGFPCQNISIAGDKKGMQGHESSLVKEIFRLVHTNKPKHIVIENVANIISLHSGEILTYITTELHSLGYNWAYRLIDPRSLGIPQRRPRFVLVASTVISPKDILFPADEVIDACIDEKPTSESLQNNIASAYGFYWTEGKIGIGWAKDSIPPLKCGSSLGLPSSPAIWDIHNNFFGCPSIHDAERLQGFPIDWTKPIESEEFKNSMRWKVIGNAVNVAVSSWVAQRIMTHLQSPLSIDNIGHKRKGAKWPKSAYQDFGQELFAIESSPYPLGVNYIPILDFLSEPLTPLSLRATLGFLKRVECSTLIKYPDEFIVSLHIYLKNQYGYTK